MKEIKLKKIGDKIKIIRTQKDMMIVEVIKDELGTRLVWSDDYVRKPEQ